MVDVYFYLPAGDADNAVECGLKLSRWAEKEVLVNGDYKKCICALLNPKDDMARYRSQEYKCVKLEIPSNHCFVADRYLYDVGLKAPEIMELYYKSVIPVDKYIFGSYRMPECIVTSTVIAGQIGVLDKRLDLPVLFDNSEGLYINNIIETYKEEHGDFNDAILYSFYCKLAENGKMDKVEDHDKGFAVFVAKEDGKVFTVKIPDFDLY